MKRSMALLLALLLALHLTGCGKQAAGGEETATRAPSAPVAQAPVYDDALIGESLAEAGGDGAYVYSYHIPKLLGEGAALAAINDQLDSTFGAQARQELADMAYGSLPLYPSIWWESHWTGSLLSLVVQAENVDRQISSEVIHYDFAQDRRLSTAQVLDRLGIGQEDFLWAARRAVIQEFDAYWQAEPAVQSDMSLYYESYYGESSILSNRAQTLAAVTAEDALIFPENGACHYIARLLLGGAGNDGWYSRTLELDFAPPLATTTVADGAVTARLEQGRVLLSFAGWPEDGAVDPDRLYEVKGLYADYVDLFLGDLSWDYRPVLFLLTGQGTLEYVDIGLGVWYGGFWAMPIPGDFTGVTLSSAEENGVDDYCSAFARWPDGTTVDLQSWVDGAQRAVPRGNWSGILEEITVEGGSYARMGNLSIQGQEMDFSITELDAVVESGFAQLQALGMAEEGIVCGCTQSSYNGPAYAGAFAYRSGLTVVDGRYGETMALHLLTGISPFGGVGGQLTFQRGMEG